ncbi:GNAT family N-acetyltransferase [Bacillus sp. KH172YL63]|uniref:GNAT family N-acetyltransferase n=1 Tax=Bacillus sp. KH172YL63 TaxID=2709784 RepID=UPI0013E4BFBA|nr:GNAT family N-acetyltransferase [Bacillus sp. KH172YL63]BCB04157.1 hypothetical protein KH172YL63_22900 [Bacillus sp. KH172YL63]
MINQQLVINNFAHKINLFTRAVGGTLLHKEDFLLADTGIPTDTHNVLLSLAARVENLTFIQEGLNRLREKGFPFSAWIDSRFVSDNWKALLGEFNLAEAERSSMMKLEQTVGIQPVKQEDLLIEKVNGPDGLKDYADILLSLFAGTEERNALGQYFRQVSAGILLKNVHMYIGRHENEVVSTGLFIDDGACYGIYDLMTAGSHRQKGYGSTMFRHLLSEMPDKHKEVVLLASQDGKRLYERFGFEEVGEMIVYE